MKSHYSLSTKWPWNKLMRKIAIYTSNFSITKSYAIAPPSRDCWYFIYKPHPVKIKLSHSTMNHWRTSEHQQRVFEMRENTYLPWIMNPYGWHHVLCLMPVEIMKTLSRFSTYVHMNFGVEKCKKRTFKGNVVKGIM